MIFKRWFLIGLVALAATLTFTIAEAQGPKGGPKKPATSAGTAFIYQGQLKNAGALVNASCSFNFGLWDASTLGNQVGVTQTVPSVGVTNGLFTAPIDFGGNAFNGDARWLGIAANCGSGLTTLNPRQPLEPAPMAFALPGLYTQQTGSSPNLIGGSSANLIGPGVVASVIDGGGNVGFSNIITGNGSFGVIGGGESNTVNQSYSTIGGGLNNTASGGYSTVGGGYGNTAGGQFSFAAGNGAQALHDGTFVYSCCGAFQSTATNQFLINAPGGVGIGTAVPSHQLEIAGNLRANSSSSNDIIVQTIGGVNSWAKLNMITPSQKWSMGTSNNFNGNQLYLNDETNSQARMTIQPNGGAISFPTGNLGVGTTSPAGRLHVSGGTSWFQGDSTPLASSAGKGVGVGYNSAGDFGEIFAFDYGGSATKPLVLQGPGGDVGIGTTTPTYTLDVNGNFHTSSGVFIDGGLVLAANLTFNNLAGGGTLPLCLNNNSATGDVRACSSSLRYKNNIADLALGLDAIGKLRPVTFDWKSSGEHDLGFVAEEVEKVTPLLTTLNKDGQIEGVKYERITAILTKGMQEQQKQIADLKTQNAALEKKNSDLESRVSAIERTLKETGGAAPGENSAIPAQWLWFGGLVAVGMIAYERGRNR
jgi:trimeric autotransporter adhesin